MFVAGIEIFFGFVAGAILLVIGAAIAYWGWHLFCFTVKGLLRLPKRIIKKIESNPLMLCASMLIWAGLDAVSKYYGALAAQAIGWLTFTILVLCLLSKDARQAYQRLNARLYLHLERDRPKAPRPS